MICQVFYKHRTLTPENPKFLEAARPERAEAPSPGHRPGYNVNQQGALTGREVCVRDYPGRCPGLGASALSGRMAQTCEILGVNAADIHARCFTVLCGLTVR